MKKPIPLATAKEKLLEIDSVLTEKLLLVGGLAVNQYVKSRDSHDIDLVCTHQQSQKILSSFPTDLWDVFDQNNDAVRPSYTATNKSDPSIIVNFGPKITERGGYEFVDWQVLGEKAGVLSHKNAELKNIAVPNASYLAYSKLISFFHRSSGEKGLQDAIDFVNLTNHETFSPSLFLGIIDRLGAAELIRSHYDKFLLIYKKMPVKSLLYRIGEMFPNSITEGKQLRFDRGTAAFVDRMLDATLYFRDATVFAADEIKSAFAKNKVLPTRLLYKTEEGCRRWLRLCESPKYSFFNTSYNNLHRKIGSVVDKVIERGGRSDFDLISLGVGNGSKELLLVEKFLGRVKSDETMYYYPMDINLILIEKTAQKLAASEILQKQLSQIRVKPFVGDYLGIDTMDLVYNYRSNPNIFSVLGNTIGNGDEGEIFATLRGAVSSGDFVLLEINCDPAGASDVTLANAPENRELDIAPLIAAGVDFSETDLSYSVVPASQNPFSIVPETVTTIAKCLIKNGRSGILGVRSKREVQLSVVHHYNFKRFSDSAVQQLNMDIAYANEENGIGLLLLAKK